MKLEEFQSFVVQSAEWFQGAHPETPASLRQVEQQLGVLLPPTMKWLLSKYGYSFPCGIDALDETVKRTLQARQSLGLQEQYVVINDHGDAGVVYLDVETANSEGECKIYWVGTHNFARLTDGEPMDEDVDVFEDYPAWVRNRLEAEIEEDL